MSKQIIVLSTALVGIVVFIVAFMTVGNKPIEQEAPAVPEGSALIRFHSPILGPADAPVTIVEFFDPACEACRAFHPIVKQIMSEHPKDVRVVMRYAAFHDGSDTAVRILESARKQGVFMPVLEALLEAQPAWAKHSGAQLDKAWDAAANAGLNIKLAQDQISSPEISAVLNQDAADIKTIGIRQTPTFFVDGRPLLEFGAEQLKEMVRIQVEAAAS